MKQTKVNTIQFKEFMKAFVENTPTIPGADLMSVYKLVLERAITDM